MSGYEDDLIGHGLEEVRACAEALHVCQLFDRHRDRSVDHQDDEGHADRDRAQAERAHCTLVLLQLLRQVLLQHFQAQYAEEADGHQQKSQQVGPQTGPELLRCRSLQIRPENIRRVRRFSEEVVHRLGLLVRLAHFEGLAFLAAEVLATTAGLALELDNDRVCHFFGLESHEVSAETVSGSVGLDRALQLFELGDSGVPFCSRG